MALKGYGFVQMEKDKMSTVLKNENVELTCGSGQPCTKTYTVINDKSCTVETYP